MAKKKEIIEEPIVETPIVETPIAEAPIVEVPKKASRSIAADVAKPEPAQIGHATRAFRGR
jgi:hypothetical protein